MYYDPSCSHLRVVYCTTTNSVDGITTGWWQCAGCPMIFVPKPVEKDPGEVINEGLDKLYDGKMEDPEEKNGDARHSWVIDKIWERMNAEERLRSDIQKMREEEMLWRNGLIDWLKEHSTKTIDEECDDLRNRFCSPI